MAFLTLVLYICSYLLYRHSFSASLFHPFLSFYNYFSRYWGNQATGEWNGIVRELMDRVFFNLDKTFRFILD